MKPNKVKVLIITLIAIAVTSITTVTAIYYATASEISFSSSKTEKDNVKDSLDELYNMANPYPVRKNVNADGLIATGELLEMNQPATTQLAATKDWRYIGADPNNYVLFNNEYWRIIGIFNVDNGSGTLEKRIKLIKMMSVGSMPYDDQFYTSGYSANMHSDWSKATLKSYLNDSFYKGLTKDAQNKIVDAKYYLGGCPTSGVVSNFYACERGTARYDSNSGDTSWTGKVGLLYISDYGYAVGGSGREQCLATNMQSLRSYSLAYGYGCTTNNWLLAGNQWTMGPIDSNNGSVNIVYADGDISNTGVMNNLGWGSTGNNGSRPVVYLKADVTLSGSGTMSHPYKVD